MVGVFTQPPESTQDALSISLMQAIIKRLTDKGAMDTVVIDLAGKSDIADVMIVTSGTSSRHIQTLADQAEEACREHGITTTEVEGRDGSDWIVVDTPYVMVHVFHPEARERYQIEKMWQADFSDLEMQEA